MDFLDLSRAVRKPNRATAFLVQQHQIRQAASSGPKIRITSSSRLAAYLAVSQLDRKGAGTFSTLSQASSKVEVCSEGAAYSPDKQVDYFRHWVKIRLKAKIRTTVSNQIVCLEHQIRLEHRRYCQYLSPAILHAKSLHPQPWLMHEQKPEATSPESDPNPANPTALHLLRQHRPIQSATADRTRRSNKHQ